MSLPARPLGTATTKSNLRRQLIDSRPTTSWEALAGLVSVTIRAASLGRFHPAFWVSTAVVFTWTVYLGISLSLLSAYETWFDGPSFDALLPRISFFVWAAGVAVLQGASARFYASRLVGTLEEGVLDALENARDLHDLRRWIVRLFDKRRQLGMSLLTALIFSSISLVILYVKQWPLLDIGTAVFIVICWFEGSLGLYFLTPSLGLAARLRRYQLNLFEYDPASSPMIEKVAEMIQECLFISAVIATSFSSGVFYFGFDANENSRRLLLLAPWLPIVGIFAFYQYCLATIVTDVRSRALKRLRSSIDTLAQGEVDAQRAGSIKAILELHETVKRSSTLAVDPKGLLGFATTMLVPAVSYLIGFWR